MPHEPTSTSFIQRGHVLVFLLQSKIVQRAREIKRQKRLRTYKGKQTVKQKQDRDSDLKA